jgi:hypothetical protein
VLYKTQFYSCENRTTQSTHTVNSTLDCTKLINFRIKVKNLLKESTAPEYLTELTLIRSTCRDVAFGSIVCAVTLKWRRLALKQIVTPLRARNTVTDVRPMIQSSLETGLRFDRTILYVFYTIALHPAICMKHNSKLDGRVVIALSVRSRKQNIVRRGQLLDR